MFVDFFNFRFAFLLSTHDASVCVGCIIAALGGLAIYGYLSRSVYIYI